MQSPIILFDGVCKFCDASINFIIDNDPEAKLRFAAQQSETGQALLKRFGLRADRLESLVLIEGDKYYLRSSAALRIAGHLAGWWRYLFAFLVVPTFLRDPVYNVLARNRYHWFGRLEACRMPTPEIRQRFLD